MLPLWHRRVSRYIDSIILNGLIKCILNNTKLEKKGATNCIYSVLRKCCYSFNFICDIIIIFPPFRARRRAREPRVNTVDGSEVAEFSSSRGWGGGGEGLVLWAEEDLAGGPVETGWAASLCWRWLQVGSPETGKQSICLQNGFFFFSTSTPVQVPVLCFACCPCCLPFVVDLDWGLCVCSLMTPTCNSAVPPPWHPINAILRYQTQSHSWLEESNCSAFLRVQRRWWRRQPLCVQLCSRLQGFVSTAWP